MSISLPDGWSAAPERTAILVPFRDGFSLLARTIHSVLGELGPARLVLVDDGSTRRAIDEPELAPCRNHPGITLLRHERNRGPAAARNTGLAWCRAQGITTVILLDADCEAGPGFVDEHLAAHARHPEAVAVGGAIQGVGAGLWARLDGMLSWFTSMPGAAEAIVEPPLHLPTTNLSYKLAPSVAPLLVFDERLRTGEDVELLARLRTEELHYVRCPRPGIVHHDRTGFRELLRHQYRWGLHTYVVRFARRYGEGWPARLAVASAFALGAPVYAAAGTWLNLRPWLARFPADVWLAPAVYAFYLLKAVAVVHGALVPSAARYPDA